MLSTLLTVFQMECAQINVTGGTGAKSPPTVSLPGAYTVFPTFLEVDLRN
jgi:hypothetical protein